MADCDPRARCDARPIGGVMTDRTKAGAGGGFALGIAIGAGIGAATGNLPIGIALGVALGFVFGKAAADRADKAEGPKL